MSIMIFPHIAERGNSEAILLWSANAIAGFGWSGFLENVREWAHCSYSEVLPNLENEYLVALKQWEQALTATHQKVVSFIESVIRVQYVPAQLQQQVIQLVAYCLDESMKFIEQCSQIKTYSSTTKDNPVAQIDHIIRESEYFIGIARVILYGNVHS